MKWAVRGEFFQPMFTWHFVFILALTLNAGLIASRIPGFSVEPRNSFQPAPAQAPAQAQWTEFRTPEDASSSAVHSASYALPIGQKVFDPDLGFWSALGETISFVPSGTDFPNLHERAPPSP